MVKLLFASLIQSLPQDCFKISFQSSLQGDLGGNKYSILIQDGGLIDAGVHPPIANSTHNGNKSEKKTCAHTHT